MVAEMPSLSLISVMSEGCCIRMPNYIIYAFLYDPVEYCFNIGVEAFVESAGEEVNLQVGPSILSMNSRMAEARLLRKRALGIML